MNDDLYQEELLDHYRHPHNFGPLPDPSCSVLEVNASCGDQMTLQLKIDPDKQVVSEAMFTGVGCAVSMASASLLTDYTKGKTIKELQTIDFDFMQQLIGTTISPGRVKCLALSAKALMKALEQSISTLPSSSTGSA